MSDHTTRKQAHIDLCLTNEVETPDAGLGRYRLELEAFPEASLDDVDLTTTFLGRTLSFPFLIAAMSGGVGEGFDLNRRLARAAAEAGCGLALGSLRPALADDAYRDEYDVRSQAPDIPLLGNIGVWQLRDSALRADLVQLTAELQLDGLFVHVNPAQELAQPEGERDFTGALGALLALLQEADFPVLLKGVGMGLSTTHLPRLVESGLAGIDVAGRGGTNWVTVEALRTEDKLDRALALALADLGQPTAQALTLTREALDDESDLPIIASGGLRTPLDLALCLALGADLVSTARPLLVAAHHGDEALARQLRYYHEGLRRILLLAGWTGFHSGKVLYLGE